MRVIGLGFLFVILIGAVLLWMPFSVTTSMKFTDCIIYVGYSSLCDRACYSYSGSTIYCGGKSNLIIPDSNWRTWNYCMRCCIYDPCRTKDFPEKTSYDPGKLWVGYAEWNGTIYYSDHKRHIFSLKESVHLPIVFTSFQNMEC